MTTVTTTGICFVALLVCASAFVLMMYYISEPENADPCVCKCLTDTQSQPSELKRPAVTDVEYKHESATLIGEDTQSTSTVAADISTRATKSPPTKTMKVDRPVTKRGKTKSTTRTSVKIVTPRNEPQRTAPSKAEIEFQKRLNKTNEQCRILPDILIFGFDKCGTMTLRQFLSVHPDIFITEKEGNNKLFKNIAEKEFDDTSKYFQKPECTPKGKLRLEKLVNSRYPESVYKYIPNIKLIAIVKEPVERVMSHYVHLVAQTDKPLRMDDFDLCARRLVNSSGKSEGNDHRCDGTNHILTTSKYAGSLKAWVDIFGVENILIIDGDNFVSNPVEELRKAEEFFGLEHKISESDFYYDKQKKFYCMREEDNTGCMSEKKGRPHPPMADSTRQLLKDYLKPYNEKFYKLIGRTFPWDD